MKTLCERFIGITVLATSGLAFLIDVAIITGLSLFYVWVLAGKSGLSNTETIQIGTMYFILYFTIFTIFNFNGRTVGMLICGLSIVRIEGGPASLKQRAHRLAWFFLFIFAPRFVIYFVQNVGSIPWNSILPISPLIFFLTIDIATTVAIPYTRLTSMNGIGILDYLSRTILLFHKFGQSVQMIKAQTIIHEKKEIRRSIIRSTSLLWCFLVFGGLVIRETRFFREGFQQSSIVSLLGSYLLEDLRIKYYLDQSNGSVTAIVVDEICINYDPPIYIRGGEMVEISMYVTQSVMKSPDLRREIMLAVAKKTKYFQKVYQKNFSFIDLIFNTKQSFAFLEYGKSLHYYYDTRQEQLIFGIADSLVEFYKNNYPNHEIRFDILYQDIRYNVSDDSKLRGLIWCGFSTP